jgi:hypothetical protein
MAAKSATYRVKSPMLHDGERYEDGDVELSDTQAAQALESKSVAKIEIPKADKSPAGSGKK